MSKTAPIRASELVRWELFRVIARKEREGQVHSGSAEQLFAGFESDIADGKVLLIPLDEAVHAEFRGLVLHMHRRHQGTLVRTVDAIHVATARLHHATQLAVTDTTMRACAISVGLKVFP